VTDGGIALDALGPEEPLLAEGTNDVNENSVVTRLTYRCVVALISVGRHDLLGHRAQLRCINSAQPYVVPIAAERSPSRPGPQSP
jgi:hypothetical protein